MTIGYYFQFRCDSMLCKVEICYILYKLKSDASQSWMCDAVHMCNCWWVYSFQILCVNGNSKQSCTYGFIYLSNYIHVIKVMPIYMYITMLIVCVLYICLYRVIIATKIGIYLSNERLVDNKAHFYCSNICTHASSPENIKFDN